MENTLFPLPGTTYRSRINKKWFVNEPVIRNLGLIV